jgi:hypothetical protein
VILLSKSPAEGWTKIALERACDVKAGTLDDHLAAAVALDLLRTHHGRFHTPDRTSSLARSLKAVLHQTAATANAPIPPLQRRQYERSR